MAAVAALPALAQQAYDPYTLGTSQIAAEQVPMSDENNFTSVEGCVTQQQNDFFLTPTFGSPLHLSGNTTGFSSQVGHWVKVRGKESMADQAINVDRFDVISDSCGSNR
jgi:hypothetical protein